MTVATRRTGLAKEQNQTFYRIIRVFFTLLFRYWVRCFRVTGAVCIPSEGGAFLIANHSSALDPFVLAAPVKNRILVGPGKIELFRHPVVGFLMKKLGIFPLRRDVIDSAAVRTMVGEYRAGRVVIVYPEGGRSKTGDLLAFDEGFARLAIKLRAPLIPAGMSGAREVLPIGRLIPRRNTPLAVCYGRQFDLSRFYGQDLTESLLAEAAETMRAAVQEQVWAAARMCRDLAEDPRTT
ncbi:MAG: lysophospholipid acyltransferase family protein [Chloroflexota bacterium]